MGLWRNGLAAALLARACLGDNAPDQGPGLHALMVGAGKLFFGTATDTNLFNDTQYLAIANSSSMFGIRVPENSQKWQPTEPTQGRFAFANPDDVAVTSRANGQLLRCHTLTWHSQLPNFVQTTAWTRDTLTAAIQSHIANVVGHFKGQCYSWDVVNEALNDNGTIRNDVFFQTMGTDYIPVSFAAAAAADPGAKLYYNDFNLETIAAKADAALQIVRLVQSAGLRIDGVGFQAHLNVGFTPNRTALAATLSRFTALGVEVAFTELDIAHTKLPPDAAAIEQQARDYVSVVGSCLAVAKCVGIVVWEFTDKYSWIPSTFPGKGDACLFDANFTKKPAYTAVSSLLAAAATGGPPQGGGGGGSFGGGVGGGSGGSGNGTSGSLNGGSRAGSVGMNVGYAGGESSATATASLGQSPAAVSLAMSNIDGQISVATGPIWEQLSLRAVLCVSVSAVTFAMIL
ncbi:hypothetical protein VTK73DRAFT_8560 [Phialemonium thermophilum]|uniref:Beta-xylanase n=1 Tax=Phialemonium thermophilum TaxID=223376 RepID=A0ABR3XPD1_9PEZI